VALAIAGGGLAVAGCTTSGQPSGQPALGAVGGFGQPTVAFDTIDGPPEPLIDKLVTHLRQEASARQLATVSQKSPAQYRIRAYVAAHVEGKKTTITWIWDVFDAGRERAVRLAGEVPGAPSERAWAAADDEVVARMARDGMTGLAAFLARAGSAPPESPSRDAPSANVASVSGTEGPLAFLQASRP
jgi:hypothetical protein